MAMDFTSSIFMILLENSLKKFQDLVKLKYGKSQISSYAVFGGKGEGSRLKN